MGNEITNESRARFAAALGEPAVPKELVERMVVRAKAIVTGREAEKCLEDTSTAITDKEKLDLAAQSIVGRMMQHQNPPKNVSGAMLAESLKKQDAFIKLASCDRTKLIDTIKNGDVFRSLAGEGQIKTQKEASKTLEAQSKKDHDLAAPEKPAGPTF